MRTPTEVAFRYMELFFESGDLTEMAEILAPSLHFEGPFHSFYSAVDYLASLRASPPRSCTYDLLDIFERGARVCLLYRFSKPGVKTPMAQRFEVKDGLITDILLVLDKAPFL